MSETAGVNPVTVTRILCAPRPEIWRRIAEPELRALWWPELQIDLKSGGSLIEKVKQRGAKRVVSGEIDVFAEGHALGFVWFNEKDHHSTSVLIALLSEDVETKLVVTEFGFGSLANAEERSNISYELWESRLNRLAESIASSELAQKTS